MKKVIALLLSVVTIALCSSLMTPVVAEGADASVNASESVTVSAVETRFLNMLNHNFVYNSDFENADTVVNNSILAILNLRDSEDQDYIAEDYVKNFVKDMYGIEIVDMSNLNSEFPHKDGYLYIVPRGYTTYTHKIVSVNQNDDGTYTVVSDITVKNHDSDAKSQKAVSLFVKNDSSAFGYNMIYCNIIENSLDV